ncbi:MAG TPA: NAD-dependent epimerase/dehydratase family protein [Flavitalea sp.]|nr:NAD-dependent epimerase/dehydratase family protein [Flavitalea sp.]
MLITEIEKLPMKDLQSKYESYLTPSDALVKDIANLSGDIIILGAGGKMGPALATVAKQAVDRAGVDKKVIAISRFSEQNAQEQLNKNGVITINADLLNDSELQALPEAENVLYMAGMKFGTKDNASLTWAMNAYLPGRVAQKYRSSRIVVFSSGNVYPMAQVYHGGVTELQSPEPIGEYAQSVLGRERMFQYFSSLHKTPLLIYRLNFAVDVTYGVLVEIATSVMDQREIDLSMGHFNVIWQGDANEIALRSLQYCSHPAKFLNVTGPETISVKWCAEEFGRLFGQNPLFKNEEQPTAYLNNAAESFRLFGYPRVTLKQMMELLAEWMTSGGKKLNKPTHFQERKGKY